MNGNLSVSDPVGVSFWIISMAMVGDYDGFSGVAGNAMNGNPSPGNDFGIVAKMCDRVAVMYPGRIVESADVRTNFNNHLH